MSENPKNYFLVKRDWQNSEIFEMFNEPFDKRSAWLFLIEKASWKDRKFMVGNSVFDLKRGQLSCSIRYLANAWRWSKTKVASFLNALQKFEMIKVAKRTAQNIITVCNYSKYQFGTDEVGTDKSRKKDDQRTVEGHLEDADWDKTKETKIQINTDKEKRKRRAKKFAPPTLDQIHEYFTSIDLPNRDFAEKFLNHYASNGWKVGKNSMKDWQATCRGWKQRERDFAPPASKQTSQTKTLIQQIAERVTEQQPQSEMKVINP